MEMSKSFHLKDFINCIDLRSFSVRDAVALRDLSEDEVAQGQPTRQRYNGGDSEWHHPP